MKALTANRLIDGEVVFWDRGQWVERFGRAELFDDDVSAGQAEAHAKSQPTVVIDAYLIDVAEAPGGVAPVAVPVMGAASWTSKGLGFVALALASVNIFGGFLVTARMLAMYKKKEK